MADGSPGEGRRDNRDRGHLLHNLLLFGRVLRGLGMDVHTGRMLDVVQALEYLGVRSRRDFQHTLRTMLVHRQQDLPLFDEAFQVFWRAPRHEKTTMDLRSLGEQHRYRQPEVGPPPPGAEPADRDEGAAPPDPDRIDLSQTYSSREVLRHRDFAEFTAEEVARATEMMSELAWDPGLRRTRRWTTGRGPRLDLQRTVRRSMQYGGEPIELARLRRKEKTRRLVLICDISGSMERYTRMLLHFIHTVMGGLGNVEAFLFATRLTRVTGPMAHRGIDQAVSEVSQAVPDWSGGTRIGDALKSFNHQWGRRVLGWGAVVLVISDGWDRGDPELVRHETARLQRSAYRLIWLNPLLGSPEYQPLTRGIRAALPFIDDHLPVHNLASLEDLAAHLNSLQTHRPGRRQQAVYSAARSDAPETRSQDDGPPPPAQRLGHRDANPSFRHPAWGKGTG